VALFGAAEQSALVVVAAVLGQQQLAAITATQ